MTRFIQLSTESSSVPGLFSLMCSISGYYLLSSQDTVSISYLLCFIHIEAAPPFPCLPTQPLREACLCMIVWSLCPLERDSVKEGNYYSFYHYDLFFTECLLCARPWAACFTYLAHWILMTNQGSRYSYHSSLQKGEPRPRDFTGSCDLNLSMKKGVKVLVAQSRVTLCDPGL